ncbi:phosphatase PAP2 family protein [Candidatus Microgenomates bacterium]|nr:phosphatase PAP2 family protein [Candidatus Microgenomates bacterium]
MKRATGLKSRHAVQIFIIEIVVGLIVNLVSLWIFFEISKGLLGYQIALFDQWIIQVVYAWRSPIVTEIMKAITLFGGTGLLASALVVAMVLSAYRRNKRSIVFMGMFLSGAALNIALKDLFHRPRPTLMPLVHEGTYSFPSGHAMNSFIFYMALALLFYQYTRDKTLGVVMTMGMGIWVFLIGLSRVYLGAHYPSDVIAGYFAGLWWLVTILIIEKIVTVETLIGKRMS